MVLPSLLATLCATDGLKVSTVIVYDLNYFRIILYNLFPQHIIADLNLWQYIYSFVQSGEVFTMKGNKHTHTSWSEILMV